MSRPDDLESPVAIARTLIGYPSVTPDVGDALNDRARAVIDRIETMPQAVIGKINDIVTNMASAIEEQAVTTREISDNVAQAASGVKEVNGSVNQSSTVAGEVTRDIAGVSQAATDIREGSRQVSGQARELSGLADTLNRIVSRFKV